MSPFEIALVLSLMSYALFAVYQRTARRACLPARAARHRDR